VLPFLTDESSLLSSWFLAEQLFTPRLESWSSADLTSRHFDHYYTSFTHFNSISFRTAIVLKYISFGTATVLKYITFGTATVLKYITFGTALEFKVKVKVTL
jgi:hypothetical protein